MSSKICSIRSDVPVPVLRTLLLRGCTNLSVEGLSRRPAGSCHQSPCKFSLNGRAPWSCHLLLAPPTAAAADAAEAAAAVATATFLLGRREGSSTIPMTSRARARSSICPPFTAFTCAEGLHFCLRDYRGWNIPHTPPAADGAGGDAPLSVLYHLLMPPLARRRGRPLNSCGTFAFSR